MRYFIFLLFFLPISIFAREIPIQLEFANNENTRSFGLMNRKFLPESQGMLFIYPEKQKVKVWMFNCFIDLSVAFLDDQLMIHEMHELKAYPEKMEGISIKNSQELDAYPENSPVANFFQELSVQSNFAATYALEMNQGWSQKNNVSIGDTLYFDNKQAYIKTKND